jgi:predicted nucleic acid-binding protein
LALYYLETSALVKLYVLESGTERLLLLTDRSSGNRFAILSLSQVEFRSAIRRRERNGEIPASVANELLSAFKRHSETRFVTQMVSDFVLDIAAALVDRYALRAFDAIQLAGYAALKDAAGSDAPIFVCSDQGLLAAAKLEGALVLDPTSGAGP